MPYNPNDIYNYIKEQKKETEFLQAITNHKRNFSIGEIVDKGFRKKENNEIRFSSSSYQINMQILDEDIITAVLNGLYVSAFISRYQDDYHVHFLVHPYPETMKARFDEAILDEVIRYMILMTIVQLHLDTPKKVDDYLAE